MGMGCWRAAAAADAIWATCRASDAASVGATASAGGGKRAPQCWQNE